MALIVEDGTGVEGADSYVTLVEGRAIAAKYGWFLPEDNDAAELSIRQGYLYLNSLEPQLAGERTHSDQTGAFPREGVKCGQFLIPPTGIKAEVKYANVRAAQTYAQGVNVMPDFDGKQVASEEVTGAVAVSYFKSGTMSGQIRIMEVEKLLGCYLPNGANSSSFRTVFR